MTDGGYDAGYSKVPCFWGVDPASLVKRYLESAAVAGNTVLDIGCGEGKNANALAVAGANVDAVDCSSVAIANGKAAFPESAINWSVENATSFPIDPDRYDMVVSYGLFHCLESVEEVQNLFGRIKLGTKRGGVNIVCAFNNRSQDLSAHPGFSPLLLAHDWYVSQFADWTIEFQSDEILYETHPHNMIPHHHSLTRLIARKR